MGFRCTIKAGNKDLTDFDKGPIHSQLLGLGPSGSDEFGDAPYQVEDFRKVVVGCRYGNRLKDAAQDCFRTLQGMARANLAYLQPEPHCETCKCVLPEKKPFWWGADKLRALLAIDAETITFVDGGW